VDEEARLLRTVADHEHEDAGASAVMERRCAGYELRDPLGQKVRLVEKIFSGSGGIPTYVAVRKRFFGRRPLLIPVRAIAVDDERRTVVLR
jgi:hypothetical protein